MVLTDFILLISPEGENLGNHDLETAQRIADERYGLNLVEVRAGTYKILDLGKLNYEASKRKTVKAKPIKEMKFKLNIGAQDYDTKIKHIRRFIEAGSTVKVTIWFSGREVSRPEAGVDLMNDIRVSVEEFATANIDPTLNGKNMHMILDPIKR